MSTYDPATLSKKDRYRLLIGAVVPRPIAWITTLGATGTVNLAPFSFFNGVTASPMVVSVAIAHRDPLKDTLVNLRARREAVVHLAPPDLLAAVHHSGADYPSDVSEADVLGLALAPSTVVAPPRLVAAPIAMECHFLSETPVGDPPTALCLLEIVRVHVADAVAGTDGMPDPRHLRAPARLGDRCYLDGSQWPVVDFPPQQVPPR